jgi:ribosome-binding factor A
MEMESHRKGELTESIVITELKKREVPVSIPFGDNERYDIVVESPNGEFLSVQVKTGWFRDGRVKFKGVSQHTNSGGNVYKQYQGDVDYFLVYCYELDTLYWVAEEEFDTRMCLRVEEPEQVKKAINWAEEYEFDNRWPPGIDDTTNDENRAVTATVNSLQKQKGSVLREVNSQDQQEITTIVDKRLYHLRIESGWVVNGRIRFEADVDDADYYLVHCAELDTVYIVNASEFDESISLRVEETKRARRSINWASNYELESNWPPKNDTDDHRSLHSDVRVAVEALKSKGYDPVVPEDTEIRRTLLVETEARTVRLRVESAWNENGRLHFDANGDTIDYYIIYYSDEERLYLVGNEIFDKSISLRVDPPERVDKTINWASNYEFDENWPPE